jgi:hypothetical protein
MLGWPDHEQNCTLQEFPDGISHHSHSDPAAYELQLSWLAG